MRLELLEDRRLLASAPLYVDVDSTAADPVGLSWATAFVGLQDALDKAAALNADIDPDNDTTDIWIAEGTYRPSKRSVADAPRSVTFQLLDGVALRGGFAGTEESPGERARGEARTIALHMRLF